MLFKIAKNKEKIQKKGGEREMKRILNKTLIILTLAFVLTSFCGYQEAIAFDVWKTVTNVINSAHDALGRLLNQNQETISNGVNLDGQKYTDTDTITFDITNGHALVKQIITDSMSHLLENSEAYSHSIKNIEYHYDDKGNLMGATGTETVNGQEKPYYTDDGVLVEGGQYNGTFQFDFTVIDGEAVAIKRSGDIVFKNSAGQERFTRHIETTSEYDIIGGQVVLVDSYTTQKDTYPETYKYNDKDGNQVDSGTHLFRAEYTHTHYDYNADGSLNKVNGTGCGWGLVNTSDGYMVYTSDITVDYEVTNGVARQTRFDEKTYFVPAENAPPIVDPGDQGKIIDMFNIRSDAVTRGLTKGAYNDYTYLVVQNNDGKVYLLRVLIHAGQGNPDQTTFNLTGYGIGNRIQFEGATLSGDGDQSANRIWKLISISK